MRKMSFVLTSVVCLMGLILITNVQSTTLDLKAEDPPIITVIKNV